MPATPTPLKRKIAAILAADVAGYSRLVAEDEERTLIELAATREIFDAIVARAGGRIFNTAGDSVMSEFDSAVEAVRAAVDIQDSIRSRNVAIEPGRRLEFRMGLTIGDVVERGGDLLGDGVNIAARLEGLAPPGGICVSRSVHEAVANKLSVGFRELGPRQVKNIPQAVHAYLVVSETPDVAPAQQPIVNRRERREPGTPLRAGSGGRAMRRVATVLAVLAVIFVAVPGFRTVRALIESYGPAGPTETKSEPVPTPPANEQATAPASNAPPPTAPPATAPPGRTARPPERPATPRPAVRDVARGDPARPDPARPVPSRPDQVRTEPPAADPPRPEPGRAEAPRSLPADPAAAYASLAKEGVLADARSLPELYHNARVLEQKGDRPGALVSYAAAAPLAGEAVDVHLRYASLLRAARGAGAVRQVYGALARTAPTMAAQLVLALSVDGDDRRGRVEAFAAANPSAAPAQFVLAESLLDGREGGPTLTERRLAFDALDRFIDAAGAGELDGRFLDRAFLDSSLDSARRRRGEIESFFGSAQTRPAAAFGRSPTGWVATITLPEPATSAAIRVGERGDFAPANLTRGGTAKVGKAATAEIELPANTGRSTLYLSYRDRAGREAGPFPLAFDPASATAEAGRTVLERFPDSWVAFRPDLPDLLSYAGLVSNRCAISRAMIGYGDDPPRERLALPPCDATGPTAMPAGTALVRLPDGTDAVQVQVTFADGTESQVRTFRRP